MSNLIVFIDLNFVRLLQKREKKTKKKGKEKEKQRVVYDRHLGRAKVAL